MDSSDSISVSTIPEHIEQGVVETVIIIIAVTQYEVERGCS